MTFGTTYLEILAVPEYSDSEFTCISGRFYDKGTNICIEVLWQDFSNHAPFPSRKGLDLPRNSLAGNFFETHYPEAELSPIHAGVDFGHVKKRKSMVGKIIEHVIQSQDKGGNNVRD
jgi:hypothetical protein